MTIYNAAWEIEEIGKILQALRTSPKVEFFAEHAALSSKDKNRIRRAAQLSITQEIKKLRKSYKRKISYRLNRL